jgi:hypothetical protein
MAQRTIIKLVNDLDNKEIRDDGQTVSSSCTTAFSTRSTFPRRTPTSSTTHSPHSSRQRDASEADKLAAQA